MDKAFGLAKQHSLSKRLRQKELYDLQVHGKPFKKDDYVWLIHQLDKHGLAKSCITHGLHGPYKVVKKAALTRLSKRRPLQGCQKYGPYKVGGALNKKVGWPFVMALIQDCQKSFIYLILRTVVYIHLYFAIMGFMLILHAFVMNCIISQISMAYLHVASYSVYMKSRMRDESGGLTAYGQYSYSPWCQNLKYHHTDSWLYSTTSYS